MDEKEREPAKKADSAVNDSVPTSSKAQDEVKEPSDSRDGDIHTSETSEAKSNDQAVSAGAGAATSRDAPLEKSSSDGISSMTAAEKTISDQTRATGTARQRSKTSSSSDQEGEQPKPEKGKGKGKSKKTYKHYDSTAIPADWNRNEYRLMYDMLLGIRLTVGQTSAQPVRELVKDDFLASVKWKIPKVGSATTPAHKDYDFKFKDYAPLVFRHLRSRFGIDAADYLVSLTSEYSLSELLTPGKSGRFFYFSADQRFIIKTMSKGESIFLRQILAHYYQHVMDNTNTLLVRFFGLHRVKPYKGKKIHFVVMGNIFVPDMEIHRRFDLKGSTVGRKASEEEKSKDTCCYKDLDFTRNMVFGKQKRDIVFRQLKSDLEFLKMLKIMDYSLLLGIHFVKPWPPAGESPMPKRTPSRVFMQQRSAEEIAYERNRSMSLSLIQLPVNVEKMRKERPAEKRMSKFSSEEGGMMASTVTGSAYPEIYYMGIIDILQPYNTRKQLEHSFKSLFTDPHGISAVNPIEYATRFSDFLTAHIGLPVAGTEHPSYDGPLSVGKGKEPEKKRKSSPTRSRLSSQASARSHVHFDEDGGSAS